MNAFNQFLNARSKREIFLFRILWICGCFCVCFEYFIYPAFLNFQSQKYSENLQSINHIQENLLEKFNQTYIPYTKVIEFTENATNSLTYFQSDDQNSLLSLQGTIQTDRFFSLLEKLSSPALLICSFSLDAQGAFSLVLKDQRIQALSSPSVLYSSPQELYEKFFFNAPKLFPFYFYVPAQSKISLNLEAILNQKAKINGTWIGIKEEIEGYKLQEIYPYFVVLHKDSQILKLYLREKRVFQ